MHDGHLITTCCRKKWDTYCIFLIWWWGRLCANPRWQNF